jgi:predicted DNA binding protein
MREAVISLSDSEVDALGLDKLVSVFQTAGLRDLEEFACYGNGAVVQVEVEEPIEVAELRGFEYVDRVERIDGQGDTELYLVAFTTPALSEDIADHAEEMVGTCDPDVGDDGVTMSYVGPQDAIRGAVGAYQTAGVSPDLRQLGAYKGREQPLDALTDRQREVIQTAFEMGYYEVPRSVSTQDLAEELELDSSTVAEHLQRAERNLLTQHLSPKT